MKIKDLFKDGKQVFSLEVFPPKRDYPIETIYKTLDELKDIHPDFISVTYGASGSERGSRTFDIAAQIKKKYGIESASHLTCVNATKEEIAEMLDILEDDGIENITSAINSVKGKVDMILCTGGMSVDPDDNTPGAIKQSGADIITYGAPVLPGAMFLLGYYEDGTPVMGLPGCVMYAKATIFDLVLPRITAEVRLSKADFVAYGEAGLCLGCELCTYPHCSFGK